MAEYGRIGSAADYARSFEQQDAANEVPKRASILNVKQSRSTVVDFGPGPYTVEHFKEFAKEIADLPPGAQVGIVYNSDREGQTLKATIIV